MSVKPRLRFPLAFASGVCGAVTIGSVAWLLATVMLFTIYDFVVPLGGLPVDKLPAGDDLSMATFALGAILGFAFCFWLTLSFGRQVLFWSAPPATVIVAAVLAFMLS